MKTVHSFQITVQATVQLTWTLFLEREITVLKCNFSILEALQPASIILGQLQEFR